eukprot:COSAG03_NODE_2212_length_3003_cov_4.915289_2_plen_57_part_00
MRDSHISALDHLGREDAPAEYSWLVQAARMEREAVALEVELAAEKRVGEGVFAGSC